jgi:sulfur-carrier protein adenylyltransferase/sulfurtransferase
LQKNPLCPICGEHPTLHALQDYEMFCGINKPSPTIDSSVTEITAVELKQWIDDGRNIQIIDVREPEEYALAKLPGAKLIPLGEIVNRAAEIDPARLTVVHCRSGMRSARAINELQRIGFGGQLINLQGGILAWSSDVDPTVPKY